MLSGEQYRFARHIDAEYGPGTALQIEMKSLKPVKYSDDTLREMISQYVKLIKTLSHA